VSQGILLLETMFFPDEIRSYDQLVPSYQTDAVSERELTMARQLIESLSTSFTPEKYRNEYREALMALIEEKARGRKLVARPQAVTPPVDLVEALEESLKLIRERGETAEIRQNGETVQQWH
jgi:DNA end-binding protein Ku